MCCVSKLLKNPYSGLKKIVKRITLLHSLSKRSHTHIFPLCSTDFPAEQSTDTII
jgi:hypothetical protein